MTSGFRFAPPCAACGRVDASVEVLPPGGVPHWDDWPEAHRQVHMQHTDPTRWRLLYVGTIASNGVKGDPLPGGEQEARDIAWMLDPLDPDAVARRWPDALGYCDACATFYCAEHWSPTDSGWGTCPRGHGRALDPHWHPAP